jgi:hypothetical protein
MIVYHAYGLHKGVTNCRSNEREPSFSQIFAHGFRLRSSGGNIHHPFPRILDSTSMDKLPDVSVKASELFLDLHEGPGVRDSRGDFELVPYDFRINE